MVICECVLSDHTLKHLEIIQNILQKNSSFSTRSDTVEILLRYIVSDIDTLSLDDLVLVDDYFSEHPAFLYAFYNDIMMSATFYFDS